MTFIKVRCMAPFLCIGPVVMNLKVLRLYLDKKSYNCLQEQNSLTTYGCKDVYSFRLIDSILLLEEEMSKK